MNASRKTAPVAALLAICLALPFPAAAPARDADSSITACLKAWGDHPFGKNARFRTLEGSVKVFGIGRDAGDTAPTSSPSLVLIEPSFNLMGGSTIELLNPNGWYCLRTMVSIMGRVNVRAHCKAQLASTSAGSTARGNNTENRNIRDLAVTAVGSVSVERPCS